MKCAQDIIPKTSLYRLWVSHLNNWFWWNIAEHDRAFHTFALVWAGRDINNDNPWDQKCCSSLTQPPLRFSSDFDAVRVIEYQTCTYTLSQDLQDRQETKLIVLRLTPKSDPTFWVGDLVVWIRLSFIITLSHSALGPFTRISVLYNLLRSIKMLKK